MTYTNQQVYDALNASIVKWDKKARTGTKKGGGPRDCPLCGLFFSIPMCYSGCPVMVKTGKSNCFCSPYEAWTHAKDFDAPIKKMKRLAADERDFLISLRKEFFE